MCEVVTSQIAHARAVACCHPFRTCRAAVYAVNQTVLATRRRACVRGRPVMTVYHLCFALSYCTSPPLGEIERARYKLKVSSSPSHRPVLFPAVRTITFDFLTVNLVSYTKNIMQHHQMQKNDSRLNGIRIFAFYDPQ